MAQLYRAHGAHTVRERRHSTPMDNDDKRFLLWVVLMVAVFALVLMGVPHVMGWFLGP
jgi:hypothetical protein